MKIILINHTFQLKYYYRRWELFAKQHQDVDVILLTPKKFTWHRNNKYSYGSSESIEGKEISRDNFQIKTFRTISFNGMWLSPDFKKIFREVKPDIIYHLGTQQQISLVQIGRIAKKYLPNTKLILFSMRGPVSNLNKICYNKSNGYIERHIKYIVSSFVTKYINRVYDAVFCHYPDAVESFIEEGFKKPIYMQTQVGVNTEWFYPSEKYRNLIREMYNIGDAYLFGSASRFTVDKGLDDILRALPIDGNWKYMMMGTGTPSDIARLKEIIKERGIEEKVIIPGFIDRLEMPKYWNAVDCAIHVPRTTQHWVETFSLSVVQPMATAKPIIVNDSGSVPYQVGPDGVVVPEGDIDKLREKMEWILLHKDEAKALGRKMYSFVVESFSVQHLNDLFYLTITEDILPGKYDPSKHDMSKSHIWGQ